MDLHRRLEPVAAAVGGDAQVERSVAGVAALVHHFLRRFLAQADLDEALVGGVVLAEVAAQAALSFVNMQHDVLLFMGRAGRAMPAGRAR
jgi:hypothetical protein